MGKEFLRDSVPENNYSPTNLLDNIRHSRHFQTQAILDKLDFSEREEILQMAFEQNPTKIPNSQELATYLAKVSEIKWFTPKDIPDTKKVDTCINELYERIEVVRPPTVYFESINEAHAFKNKTRTKNDWLNAWVEIARDAERIVSNDPKRHSVYQLVRQAGLAVSAQPTDFPVMQLDAQRRAAGGAQWHVVSDLIDRQNPFEPLMDIFHMGLWPIGHVQGVAFGVYVPKPKT